MDRKQLIIAIGFFAFLIFISVSVVNNITNITGLIIGESPSLGYCPTMKPEATNLANKNNYDLVEFSSAAEVLQALSEGRIDNALIGRKATSHEIGPETKEEVLESGKTLVSGKGGDIHTNDLSGMEIHTYLEKEEVEKILPDSDIIYYGSFDETIDSVFEKNLPILISWEDWLDDFQLVTVFEGQGTLKDKNFRGAFLYF